MTKHQPTLQPKFLSVALPVYDMRGVGHIFLKHSFDILTQQTFKDFDVVISDYSETDLIKNLCFDYQDKLDIKYHKNLDPVGGMSANVNNAIQHATGKIIKILFQDDFLYDEKSLAVVVDNFDLEKDHWLVTACEHSKDGTTFFRPFYPKYNDKMIYGNNTISSPSVLTIKNDHPLLFDTNLKWLMDCDYYQRCFEKFGLPKIVNTIAAVNRIGDHQISNNEATEVLKQKEYNYVVEKHHGELNGKIQLKNLTLVAVSSIKIPETIEKLIISMEEIEYGEVILISHEQPKNLPSGITFKKCEPIHSIDAYSQFMAYDLINHIRTDFVLVIQYDGYVLRPKKWDNIFLNYDYIGAPWPKDVHFTNEGVNVRVGNGGFSLRSKRLLNILNELHLPFTDNGTGYFNEDGLLCVYYRKQLEQHGIRFAPVTVAAKFSHESDCPDSESQPFGFHKNAKQIPLFFFLRHKLRKLLRSI